MDKQPGIRRDALYTVILAPSYRGEEIKFEGYAKSVSSKNPEGNFDVLPEHENFVTLIVEGVVIVDENGQKHEFKLGKGLLEAESNLVKIFVEF